MSVNAFKDKILKLEKFSLPDTAQRRERRTTEFAIVEEVAIAAYEEMTLSSNVTVNAIQ